MLSCQKDQFQLPEGHTYLNCAYMSPLLKKVEQAGIQGLQLKRAPYIIQTPDFFETGNLVREAFAKLINAKHPERICTIPSVSYGMAIIANNLHLRRGDQIVVVGEQFPSNYYAWERKANENGAQIHIVTAPEDTENRGKIWNKRILEAIKPGTRLVSMAHVHWADGTKFDLKAIRARSREVGAYLVLDGTQSVGALPFDITEIEVDALICAAYKWLLGPYSIGVAYLGEAFLQGIPVEESWMNRKGSENFSALVNYQSAYQHGAKRYEVGEFSNFILLPMLLESLNTLNEWNPKCIQAYCKDLVEPPILQLKNLGFQIEDDNYRGAHLWGIRLPGKVDALALKKQLELLKIYVSIRGNAVRVAPNIYNTREDLERLVECLGTILSQ